MEQCGQCGNWVQPGVLNCLTCGASTPESARRWAASSGVSTLIVDAAVARGDTTRPVSLGPFRAVVCTSSKWQVLTKMHVSLVVAPVPPGWATPDLLDALAKDSLRMAMGSDAATFVGLQSGMTAVTAAVVDEVPPGAEVWASKRAVQFGGFGVPVLVDASSRRVFSPKGALVGAAYNRVIRKLVTTAVIEPVGGTAA